MGRIFFRFAALAGVLVSVFLAPAQVITTGDLRGVVEDTSGATIPNAKLVLADQSTQVARSGVSDAQGAFTFFRLQPGSYQLTASADGFQTTVYSNITVGTARTVDVVVKLNVGAISERVEVTDTAIALETSSNTIATTVSNDLVQKLPLAGRDVLGFALLMAGAQRGSSDRSSTFNGLPNASLNITLDGVNNNSQRFRSGGTSNFVFAPLRLGAIEEVTVSTTGMGADAGGQGAMQMRFVTKRGTNEWRGSLFWQFRNDWLNANNWFNNARGIRRPILRQNEYGGNFGGPILKNKLFFFLNVEELRVPNQAPFLNTVLNASAREGNFSYVGTDGVQRTVNLLNIARQNGFPATVDSTVNGILRRMAASESAGLLVPVDLNRNSLNWNQAGATLERFPTARLDYQLNNAISLFGSWNLRWRDIKGTRPWPSDDFAEQSRFRSTYYVASLGVGWTPRATLFNEFRFGIQSNVELFNVGEDLGQFNLGGTLRRVNFPLGVPPIIRNNAPIPRNNPVWNFYDTVNWVKGKHTFTFGGTYRKTTMWESIYGGAGIPNYNLGVVSADPVAAIFSATALPAIRAVELQDAWNLYGMLTGRLTAISTNRAVDENSLQYQDLAPNVGREAQTNWGLYVQDSWRLHHTFTLNYGLRWEFSGAVTNTNGTYTSPTFEHLLGPSTGLFQPGVLNGVANPQIFLRPDTYRRDYNNPAPNVGFAWNPHFDKGPLARLFGKDRKTVLRGSFGINYYDEGLLATQTYAAGNPGRTQNLFLNPGDPGFAPGALSLSGSIPALRTFPAAFSPPFPQSDYTFSGTAMQTVDPNLKSPYVVNWSFGIQREIGRKTVVEARYVGNRGVRIWRAFNLNEVNTVENGFVREFQNAQNNLAINRNAGVNSFENRGLPGQVPLPIFQAAFGALGNQPAVAAAQGFANGTFINNLTLGTAGATANAIAGSPIYLCRMVGSALRGCADRGFTAGGAYPINFFQPNPVAAGAAANIVQDNAFSTYNALQVELRRSFSRGFTMTANYTWSKTLTDLFAEQQASFRNFTTLRNRAYDKGPSVFDLRHALQAYATYDLPFGTGKAISAGRALNHVIGGWTLSTILRMTSGRPFQLISGRQTLNQQDGRVVLKGGITTAQLQEAVNVRPGPNRNIIAFDSRFIGADGRANLEFLDSPTTPGQIGSNIFLYGPAFFQNDLGLLKQITFTERINASLEVLAINALNHPVFSLGGQGVGLDVNSTTFGQTTTMAINPRNVQLRLLIRF
ncbi:MAG TPA: hypothetical protein DEH78_15675 [Solibacterales bacterium]|nr:hypothetical protein [Bryobacterales bacterium]